ncbi:MAG TPA: SigE family RNA polymerase sigma factor [Candidatus Limnocylindrales bacterium]
MDDSVSEEFTAFVRERGHVLFRVAFSLCGQQHAAEDLMQTALARAAIRWGSIDDPEPYVKRILYREFVSAWRWRRIRPEVSVGEPPDAPQAGDHAERTALRLSLERILNTLPPKQRAVLVLRFLEDRSEREAAEILGCSEGTVASQASRALAKLRLCRELRLTVLEVMT